MEEQAVQKFTLGDIWAAVISDLDVYAEPWQIHCAACSDSKPQFILFARRLDRPEIENPDDPPFVQQLRRELDMDFYFCACSKHVSGWGSPGQDVRIVTIDSSRDGSKARLSFSRLSA